MDLDHYYGNDISASATGDLALADTVKMGEQRVYRRLLTNSQLTAANGTPIASPDYTWHPTYGAGLPRKVGSPGNSAATAAIVKGQMALEATVAKSPKPTVNVLQNGNTSSVMIQYTEANTASTQFVSFDITS